MSFAGCERRRAHAVPQMGCRNKKILAVILPLIVYLRLGNKEQGSKLLMDKARRGTGGRWCVIASVALTLLAPLTAGFFVPRTELSRRSCAGPLGPRENHQPIVRLRSGHRPLIAAANSAAIKILIIAPASDFVTAFWRHCTEVFPRFSSIPRRDFTMEKS